eukprot:UN10243
MAVGEQAQTQRAQPAQTQQAQQQQSHIATMNWGLLIGTMSVVLCNVIYIRFLHPLCLVKVDRRNVMFGQRSEELNAVYIERYANITAHYFREDIKADMNGKLAYKVNEADLNHFYQIVYDGIANMSRETEMMFAFQAHGNQELRVNISINVEQKPQMNDINVTTKYCFDLYYYECKYDIFRFFFNFNFSIN